MRNLATDFSTFRGPFDASAARHLLRRSGLGAARAEVDTAVAAGLERTVEPFFERDGDLGGLAPLASAIRSDIGGVQAYFAACLATSKACEREKLALFWHGHFATSNDKVDDPRLMCDQLELFRTRGTGRFVDLLQAIAKDAAMLTWLDAEKNRPGRPNENFARELFELFSLGIGNYSEHDIQEAARAFTGFRKAGSRYEFVAALHDGGTKTVFGRSGAWRAEDIVEMAAAHPATPRFLARKLLRFYVTPEPHEDSIDAFAAILAANQFAIGQSLRTLFSSNYFFAAEHRATRIASPVEFVIGALRSMEARSKPKPVAEALAKLGQNLLRPPTVKGWDGEAAFIQTTLQLSRMRIAKGLADGALGVLEDDALAERVRGTDSAEIVDQLAPWLVPVALEPDVRSALIAVLDRNDAKARRRVAIRALLSLPEASLV